MKAVRVGEPGTVTVTDVPEPRLQDPRDAVVKVTAAASVVSHRMPLDDAAQAYQLSDQRIATKAVLYP